MRKKILVRAIGALAAVAASGSAVATNGMNLEGYGPTATAMGGASAAYDNSNSAVMNNPATLSLMEANTARLSLGIRSLGPNVNSYYPEGGPQSGSDGDAYYMPSISYMRKTDNLVFGAAVLAQGGMGTEYGNDSPLFAWGCPMSTAMTGQCNPSAMSGEDIRSELSVGRLMFPISYNVNDRLTVGGSFDVSWASMDMQMDMDGFHFAQLAQGNGGSVGGNMAATLNSMIGPGPNAINDVNWARFDFSDDKDYTGEAMGWGVAGKIGATFKVNEQLRLGAAYHTKTAMEDLETNNATMGMNVVMGGQAQTMKMTGDLQLRDFQWPATFIFGGAFQATDRLMLAADVKWIDWSGVMDAFRMSFQADSNPNYGPFSGQNIDVTMDQMWDDQTILQLGAAYKINEQLTLRGGASFADNPIPSAYLNPLFPATIEDHYSLGFTYAINPNNNIAGSLTYAPEVEQTNADGVEVTHSQMNWQLGYVYTFK